jgi:phosphoribosyl 1,2-cyclic phosphate phosphodiesterase
VGVPVIGCACKTCASADPRNRRLRPSVWIEADGFSLLVDTSPDLRQQAILHRVDRVDAVLYTHSHADHILGLDEVRIYNFRQRAPLPAYGSARTLADIRRSFWYAFEPVQEGGGVPRLDLREVAGPFRLGPFEVVPVPLLHGGLEVLGYRIGGFAYCTDVGRIPEGSEPLLRGLEVLVLSALRYEPHPTHQTIPDALRWVEWLAPRAAYLTHMTHDVDHARLEEETPPHVHPAHDGLVLEL